MMNKIINECALRGGKEGDGICKCFSSSVALDKTFKGDRRSFSRVQEGILNANEHVHEGHCVGGKPKSFETQRTLKLYRTSDHFSCEYDYRSPLSFEKLTIELD
jgi:hypothetical protein